MRTKKSLAAWFFLLILAAASLQGAVLEDFERYEPGEDWLSSPPRPDQWSSSPLNAQEITRDPEDSENNVLRIAASGGGKRTAGWDSGSDWDGRFSASVDIYIPEGSGPFNLRFIEEGVTGAYISFEAEGGTIRSYQVSRDRKTVAPGYEYGRWYRVVWSFNIPGDDPGGGYFDAMVFEIPSGQGATGRLHGAAERNPFRSGGAGVSRFLWYCSDDEASKEVYLDRVMIGSADDVLGRHEEASDSGRGTDSRVYAMHEAVLAGDYDEVNRMLEAGVPPGMAGHGEKTALHLAAARGETGLAELLLDAGADPDARDRYGWSPLHFAAYGGHRDIASLLLDGGADVNASDERGKLTPLHRAALRGRPGVIEVLLERGARVDALTEGRRIQNGMTPLHWAAAGSAEGNTRAVELLLSAGADARLADNAGMTALHWAVLSDRAEMVEMLLKAGASADARDDRGESVRDFVRRSPHHSMPQTSIEVSRLLEGSVSAEIPGEIAARLGDAGKLTGSITLPEDGWMFALDSENKGAEEGWHAPDFDDSGWNVISIGQFWQEAGYDYIGAAWYRRILELPDKKTPAALLAFLSVDESAWVWVNGEYAGGHDIGPAGWDKPFHIDVTDHLRWGEENHIAVRVKNTAAMGGIYMPVKINRYGL